MRLQVCSAAVWCYQGPRLLLYLYAAILSCKRLVLVYQQWLPQHQLSHSQPLSYKMDKFRESNVQHADDS